MDEDDSKEPSLTIVCAGKPYCDLKGLDAIRRQEQGCPWCSYIHTDEDGQEYIHQPGYA